MLKTLTPLRFVLIVMIFFHHVFSISGGVSSVACFFVLSGFCYTIGYEKKINASFSYEKYLVNRCKRFFPIHWITLLCVIIIGLLFGEHIGLKKLITNVLLLQSYIPSEGYFFSFNAVSWYLSTLFLSVSLLPAILWIRNKLTLRGKMYVAFVLLVAYFVVFFQTQTDLRKYFFYICPFLRTLDFVFGIYIADLFKKIEIGNIHCHIIVVFIIIAVSLISLYMLDFLLPDDIHLFAPAYWVPSAALIISCSILDIRINHQVSQVILWMTQCSFSFMMWHYVVLYAFYKSGIEFSMLVVFLLFVGSYVLAQISFYIVERPLGIIKVSR